jgi:hypothetical protein
MGFSSKYGKVTTEHGDIPDDEPVIVFRARDEKTCPLISHYYNQCLDGGSPGRHLELIEATYTRFADWQEANPDKVRTPDSERSREWMGDRLSLQD